MLKFLLLCDIFNQYRSIFQTMECDAHEVNLHTSDLDQLDWSSEVADDLFYHSRGFSGKDDSVVLRTSDLADSDNSSNDEDKFGDKMFTLPTPAPKETHDGVADHKWSYGFELTFFKFKKWVPGMYSVISQQKRKP